MSTLKSALLWTTALAGANYLSNGAVVNTVTNAATNVANIMSTGVSTAAPMIGWALAPAIAAWVSAYNATGEYPERGIWGMTEKWLLNYGLWAWALTALWVISAPAVVWTATAGLWMYGIRHGANVARDFIADPVWKIWTALTTPLAWAKSGLSSLRWRWTPVTA